VKNSSSGDQLHLASDTVTASAPAVNLSPVVTTSQVSNADGSTSTRTVTETTTVAPVQQGTTIANTTMVYPTTTTTTTTTVNNNTQVSTTDIVTKTEGAPQTVPSADSIKFPDDYNKEVTQLQVLDELKGGNAPPLPNQQQVVANEKVKSDTDLTKLSTDAKTDQADKSAWFAWVWTPPVGSCSAFSGNVHGFAVSVDVCPTINNIRDVIGFLLGLFASVSVYTELFKRNS